MLMRQMPNERNVSVPIYRQLQLADRKSYFGIRPFCYAKLGDLDQRAVSGVRSKHCLVQHLFTFLPRLLQ